jgi:hypothetical protein
MNALHYLGKNFCKNAASALLVLFSLTACAAERYPEKPPVSTEPDPLKGVTFTIDPNGELIIKDSNGKPIGDRCSTDPKAENVCSIFKQGHEVQIEQMSNISLTKYHGSPQCYLMIINGRAYIIPGAAYCK